MTRKTYLKGLYDALSELEGREDCKTAAQITRTLIMKEEKKRR
ncbi:hypothetical protein [Dyadobacter sp. CY356]|nr:hypothetical protein [Dyadobacter sp. CY356]